MGSMDIEKLYTSTLARASAKVIQKMIVESGLVFEGVDYDALGKRIFSKIGISWYNPLHMREI